MNSLPKKKVLLRFVFIFFTAIFNDENLGHAFHVLRISHNGHVHQSPALRDNDADVYDCRDGIEHGTQRHHAEEGKG